MGIDMCDIGCGVGGGCCREVMGGIEVCYCVCIDFGGGKLNWGCSLY